MFLGIFKRQSRIKYDFKNYSFIIKLMKSKIAIPLLVLFFQCLLLQPAQAHTWSRSLAGPSGTYDVYRISCSTDLSQGSYLEIKFYTTQNLSLALSKGGQTVTTTSPGQRLTLTGNNGDYDVTVTNISNQKINYTLDYHCKTAAGVHSDGDTERFTVAVGVNTASKTFDFLPPEFRNNIKESQTEASSLVVDHGCTEGKSVDKLKPIIAQTLVFPNSSSAKAYKIDSNETEMSLSISDFLSEFVGVNDYDYLPLQPNPIASRDIFASQKRLTDANGTVRGFELSNGKLPPTVTGETPFMISAPTFAATSCAKRLLIRVGVINYCLKTLSTAAKSRADVWMPHTTARLNDASLLPDDEGLSNYWPTLIVERDLVTNPLPEQCTDTSYDLAIEPSDDDIDQFLPIKGYWPK